MQQRRATWGNRRGGNGAEVTYYFARTRLRRPGEARLLVFPSFFLAKQVGYGDYGTVTVTDLGTVGYGFGFSRPRNWRKHWFVVTVLVTVLGRLRLVTETL